jgi:predicted nucleic acid-binding protein
MEWLNPLRGNIIAIDTSPFIYFVEQHPRYLPVVKPLFEAIDRGEIAAVTSMLTVLEVLVRPLKANNQQLAAEYRNILLYSRNMRTLIPSQEICEAAAQLRASSNLRTPDALQLATALYAGASHFVTNDASISDVSHTKRLLLDDFLPDASTK